MTNIRNIPWPRVFAETAIIVASILIAFSVDAWWSDRQEAIEERAILISLRTEAVELAKDIAFNRSYAEAIQSSTTKLANFSLEGATSEQADDIDQLLVDFLYHVDPWFTDAPVLESLFYTGDLEQISSGELRRQISQVRSRLNGLRYQVARESKYFNETVIPYLQRNADIAQYYTRPSYRPGSPNNPDEFYVYPGLASSVVKSQLGLIGSPEFQNILLHRLTTLNNTSWPWQESEIDEPLNRLVKLIDRELSGQ